MMIATGGLLRINARRQDSLRTKTQRAHTHKRKSKKKRRSEVVVVKGKLKLFSLSGLVAALGIMVLLLGVFMAALGYWPRDGLFFTARPQEGATMAARATAAPEDAERGEELQGGEEDDRGGGGGAVDGIDGVDGVDGVNATERGNTTQSHQRSFLENFLHRYLYSDRLKVLGPLIMGIGIFLFICANAVLHENRDKKTKVINLRDIYSTVIDLHHLRPGAPPNGLVNYIQSKSLEAKPRAYPASLMRREGGVEGGGEPSPRQPLPGSNDGGDTVFSLYQEQAEAPATSSHRLSLPPSFSPPLSSTCWTSPSSSTLPRPRPLPPAPQRRPSVRLETGVGGEEEEQRERRSSRQEEEEEEVLPCPPLSSSTPPPGPSSSLLLLSCSSLTTSHLSLSSLSHLLSSSSPPPPCRRRSLPSSGAAGYRKLMQREDQSFDSADMTSQGGAVTSHRKFSNREKLWMISQTDSGLRSHDS